ncbi:MAG: rod shape-determining protein MreC [Kiritimatiellia bacterium]|nr:rod shape-determining protein MreC [Kiritimatiellia bacterium]MDD4172938.1 rod shape-determining protein MreC [Kiritimatiellia bacterium]MDD4441111.1 rod shape-determining protein MreC [Kiritimatiellia bacterium]
MKQAKRWVWLLAVSLGVLVFWHAGVSVLSREALYPYENAKVWLERTVWVRLQAVLSRARNAARASMLERDVARLRLALAESEALETEVARLRALLDFSPPIACRWQAAPVLSRGGTSAVWQSVRLAKGSLHGVRKGDPVVVPDGVVGRVTEVSPHTCEVMLITDPNSRVACELETPGEGVGVVRGILYGGGARPAVNPVLTLLYVVEPLRLRYLARDFEPPPRTRIVTSGLGPTYPKGLTVGYLLESSLESDGLSREAAVMPAVDMAALDEVFILTRQGGRHAR